MEVILADDGLQHLRLARDCEIVVIDGMRGFGNGRLLPAGPLREPAARLRQADVVVVNGRSEHAALARAAAACDPRHGARRAAGRRRHRRRRAARRPLADFRGQRVHAVAGIGNPARFFALLRAHGLEICEHAFPDHHALAAAELAFGDEVPVLMTEKDAVKCALVRRRAAVVRAGRRAARRGDARELLARVLAKVRGSCAASGGSC